MSGHLYRALEKGRILSSAFMPSGRIERVDFVRLRFCPACYAQITFVLALSLFAILEKDDKHILECFMLIITSYYMEIDYFYLRIVPRKLCRISN